MSLSASATATPFPAVNCQQSSDWSSWSSCFGAQLCDTAGYRARLVTLLVYSFCLSTSIELYHWCCRGLCSVLGISRFPSQSGDSCPYSTAQQIDTCSLTPPATCAAPDNTTALLCRNGVLDINETDIDCGGSCGLCSEGRMCVADGCAPGFVCSLQSTCVSMHVSLNESYVSSSISIQGVTRWQLTASPLAGRFLKAALASHVASFGGEMDASAVFIAAFESSESAVSGARRLTSGVVACDALVRAHAQRCLCLRCCVMHCVCC